jgi:hypothetical protein
VTLKLDSLAATLGRFVKRKRHVAADITTSTSTPTTTAATEDVTKDIAKRAEDVADIAEVCPAIAIHTGVAVLVVAGPFVRVVQYLERLAALLEASDGFFVAGVLVGVELDRELPISRSDIALGRRAFDAQDFVVAALGGHG